MTDGQIRAENASIAVTIYDRVREESGFEVGDDIVQFAEDGVVVTMSNEVLTVQEQRAIEDAVRDIAGKADD